MQTIITNKKGLTGLCNSIDKALNEWENEQRGKIELIAIRSDNRHVVYSVKGELGKGIFEGKIEELGGRKYYSHKGINYPLPYMFQCKIPVLR